MEATGVLARAVSCLCSPTREEPDSAVASKGDVRKSSLGESVGAARSSGARSDLQCVKPRRETAIAKTTIDNESRSEREERPVSVMTQIILAKEGLDSLK